MSLQPSSPAQPPSAENHPPSIEPLPTGLHSAPQNPAPQNSAPQNSAPQNRRNLALTLGAFSLLLLGAALFAISLLAIFQAPTSFIWLLAIGATEFGHWFGAGSLTLGACALLLWRIGRHAAGTWQTGNRVALILNLAASILFFSPLTRAWLGAQQAGEQLARAFPHPANPNPQPLALSLSQVWNTASTQAVAAENLQFAAHGAETLHLRFFRSQKPGPAPCIVVIHTGGWNNGTPDEFTEFNTRMALRGYAVAAIEYRLAPHWKWPAQREDVVDALNYLRTNASALGVDPSRVVLLGRSAGGQIAEAAAYSLHDPNIRGVIAFYAPADMHFAYRYARSDDILDSAKLLTDYLAGGPNEQPANYDSASGYGLANKDSPPTLLLHGKRDELVWFLQSQRLDARLQQLGVPHYFLQLDWATHAFDYNPNSPGGQLSTQAVEWFLESVLPLTPPTRP